MIVKPISVVLLNSRCRRRMMMSQMIKFVKEAVKDLVYNISLTSTATDQFDSWEEGRGGETEVIFCRVELFDWSRFSGYCALMVEPHYACVYAAITYRKRM